MKKKLGFIFLLFTASVSYGQFSDTAALNQYLRDIIKDRRPARITAADLQKGLLGITQFLGNTNIFEGADQYDSLEGAATTRHTLNTATVEAAMGFADIDPRFPLAAKTFVIQGRDKDDNDNIIARPLALNPYKDNFQGYNYVSVGSTTPTAPFSVFDGTNGVGLLFTPSTVSDIAQIAAVNYTEDYNTATPLSLVADGVRISHWNAGLSSASSLTIDGSLALSVRKSFPGGDYNPLPLNSQFHVVIITNAGQNINLPAAAGIDGRTYKIVNYSSGSITTNIPFIAGSGGTTLNTIPNNTAIELIAAGGSWYLISD